MNLEFDKYITQLIGKKIETITVAGRSLQFCLSEGHRFIVCTRLRFMTPESRSEWSSFSVEGADKDSGFISFISHEISDVEVGESIDISFDNGGVIKILLDDSLVESCVFMLPNGENFLAI